MILVFGSICMDIHLQVPEFPQTESLLYATAQTVTGGGKGANQALAAARSGAKVALVGKTGEDVFAQNYLMRLRQQGIITSSVGRSERNMTGTRLYMETPAGERRAVISLAANTETTADQIPDEILNDKVYVLLQTELGPAENAKLLARAKACGAQTILNLAPSIELSQKTLNDADYLIVNHEQASQLAHKIGLKAEEDALKLAEGLSKQGNLNCIITLSDQGTVAYTTKGAGWHVDALPLEVIVDRSGAQDAYCGTFAACLEAGMPLPRALKRASIAGSLTCTKKGEQDAFPYLADIDARINDLPDPQQVGG